MNCWKLLGIEPTTSTLAIKKAYTTLLRSCNPEDKPKEFQALRKAYQAALKDARNIDNKNLTTIDKSTSYEAIDTEQNPTSYSTEEAKEIKEVELLIQVMTTLYQDTKNRWSIDAWATVFKSPIFWDIDLSQKVKLATITFFVNHPCLPEDIVFLVNQSINFQGEHANLMRGKYRQIAEQFTTILNTAHLRFNHLALEDVNCNFDELNTYLQLRREFEDSLIFDNDKIIIKKLESILATRDARFAGDTLLDQSLAQQYLNQQSYDKALAILERVNEQHKTLDTLNMAADIKLQKGDIANAHELYRQALLLEPNDLNACKGSGLCFYQEQQHSIAINILEDVEERASADIEVKTFLTKARSEYFEILSKQASPDNLIERAETLLGLERYKECYWLFGEPPEEVKGVKGFFSRTKQEPEAVRLLRARSSANFGYGDFAASVYCTIIKERLKKKENIVDVLKDMLVFCAYKLTPEQVTECVLDHMGDLTAAAHANSITDPDYWLAVGVGHFRITRKIKLSDEERRKHDQRTIFAFNQLVSMKPHSADYHLERGYVFVFIQQYEQSIISNEIAAKSYMYRHGIRQNIGKAYRHLKQYDKALEALNIEMSLRNNDEQRAEVYEQISLVHFDMQDYKKAVDTLKNYRKFSKNIYIEDNFLMSKMYFRMEDSDENRTSYTENLMDWHEDVIEAAQKHDRFNELYLHSPDFIEALERTIVIAKKSFPAKLGPYERFLNKIKA